MRTHIQTEDPSQRRHAYSDLWGEPDQQHTDKASSTRAPTVASAKGCSKKPRRIAIAHSHPHGEAGLHRRDPSTTLGEPASDTRAPTATGTRSHSTLLLSELRPASVLQGHYSSMIPPPAGPASPVDPSPAAGALQSAAGSNGTLGHGKPGHWPAAPPIPSIRGRTSQEEPAQGHGRHHHGHENRTLLRGSELAMLKVTSASSPFAFRCRFP